MKMSDRELILGTLTVVVVLFGLTALLAKPKIDELKELNEQKQDVANSIKIEKRLVEKRDFWENKLTEMSKLLPMEPADKDMDVHWLSVMDRIASKHGVKIKKRLANEEVQLGDVYELPIECKEWEANLDSLVNFLFELQSEGAMLDIRQLMVKPKGKGMLKGRFTLYCAYTREKAE
jgi:Tfp pilus assembly protein PilN